MPVLLDPCADPVSSSQLVALADHEGTPKVSLCLPTHRVPTRTGADRIVLTNLLRTAREELASRGLRPEAVEELLAPASARLAAPDRWADLADGLALYLAPGWSAGFRLPYPVDATVVVGPEFHLRDLLPLAAAEEGYWLLALSRKTLRLWRADGDALEEQDLPGVPTSLEEALRFEDRTEQLQLRATTAGREGGAAAYHGHGGTPDDRHAAFERFLHAAVPGLDRALAGRPGPIVVAATEDNAARLRAVSTATARVTAVLAGNPDRADARALGRQARSALEGYRAERLRAVLERIEDRRRDGQGGDSVESVLAAALQGRVDTLVVRPGPPVWGAALPDGTVTRHEPRQPGSVDLVAVAAVAALRSGARLLVGPAEPHGRPLAALLRHAGP